MRVLLLPVEGSWYALPLGSLREVVAAPLVARVPAAPATVRGLFNLRGEIVPLLDTAMLLGIGALSSVPYAAVLDTPLGPAGLGASDLPEAGEIGERVDGGEEAAASATHLVGRELAALVDPAALLGPGLLDQGAEPR
jgi:purine-binding chemotaxis protein CheW